MSACAFQIVGLTGDPSGDRRLDAAVRAALGGAEEISRSVEFIDFPAVGDGIRSARFRSQLGDSALTAMERFEGAAGLILGVPIERGTVPGQFKHLFDLTDPERLRGKPALIFVHFHAGDDAASIRRQVEFLTESFGLELPHEIVLVDRSHFASDGRLQQDSEKRFVRAGRILAMSVANASGQSAFTETPSPGRRSTRFAIVR